MMRLPYLPAKTATFYCCGDMAEVIRLIGYLPGLGKGRKLRMVTA